MRHAELGRAVYFRLVSLASVSLTPTGRLLLLQSTRLNGHDSTSCWTQFENDHSPYLLRPLISSTVPSSLLVIWQSIFNTITNIIVTKIS